jgi:hypothetical protein
MSTAVLIISNRIPLSGGFPHSTLLSYFVFLFGLPRFKALGEDKTTGAKNWIE